MCSKGQWNQVFEETTTLLIKLTNLATELGGQTLEKLGYAMLPTPLL